jgi:hypothetical protein
MKSINEELLEKLARDKSFGHFFHVTNDIPKKKLNNAIKSYCEDSGAEYETPLILLDDTVFGSAKKGFLLTEESLNIKDDDDKVLNIQLRDINAFNARAGRISVNGKGYKFLSEGEESNWKIFDTLLKDYLSLK